jgi:hypothetical protein
MFKTWDCGASVMAQTSSLTQITWMIRPVINTAAVENASLMSPRNTDISASAGSA